jgi:hypothetical protein
LATNGVGQLDSILVADVDHDENREIVVNAVSSLLIYEVPDPCEDDGLGNDCNENGRPDNCDIEDASSTDCDSDSVPDDCQPDADGDRVIDACDVCIAVPDPGQADADSDAVGDLCDNCVLDPNPDQRDDDGDAVGQACDTCVATPAGVEVDVVGCPAHDCNSNQVDDGMDIDVGSSADCDGNALPDECQLLGPGCPFQRGDVNNDGEISNEDVLPFGLVLLGHLECGCSITASDVNGDGAANKYDIEAFTRLVRCNLGLPGSKSPTFVQDYLHMCNELGVELDLGTLLQRLFSEPLGLPKIPERDPRRLGSDSVD